MTIYFVYNQPKPDKWRDGIWAAMSELARIHDVHWINIGRGETPPTGGDHVLLLWGTIADLRRFRVHKARKKIVAIASLDTFDAEDTPHWDVAFTETWWHREIVAGRSAHPDVRVAFGTNVDIYRPLALPKIFDWISVGHFANWKRLDKVPTKDGLILHVGQDLEFMNPYEGPPIVDTLLRGGVIVSPAVPPAVLATFYNMSRAAYIPAAINGGAERAVLEARACGLPVEIEPDNPKLAELCAGPVFDHHYYAARLAEAL